MEPSYAWISTCLACDAKVMCQAITGLIGDVGENMKLEEVDKGRGKGVGNRESSSSLLAFGSPCRGSSLRSPGARVGARYTQENPHRSEFRNQLGSLFQIQS